jgi:hypothetical protein
MPNTQSPYVEAKQRQNVLDYDDLLLYWAQMVSDPTLADCRAEFRAARAGSNGGRSGSNQCADGSTASTPRRQRRKRVDYDSISAEN